MRIAISGSTGLVGEATITKLERDGHDIVRLVRSPQAASTTQEQALWNPATGELDTDALGAIDAVVHLAGANVAGGRWTKARKAAIRDSRGPATTRLCESLAALPTPPKVFVCASATGIYPPGPHEVDEDTAIDTSNGASFLTEVARAWEDATNVIANAGARVVNLRIGIVLSRDGGALARMLLPFRLGIGGRLGDGKQWMSWISLTDLVRVIEHALTDTNLRGPVLAVSPNPVDNRTFTKALGKVLRRPTWLPVPAFALRLLFGEMADALLLASHRARPQRLLQAGFTFSHPDIENALADVLGT